MARELSAQVDAGVLQVEDNGLLTYKGQVCRRPVLDAWCMDEERLVLVRLDVPRSVSRSVRNLAAVTCRGEVAWWAEMPQDLGGSDYYVSCHLHEGEVSALSRTGYRVELDPTTGEIKSADLVS